MTLGEITEIDLTLNPSNPESARSALEGLEGKVTERQTPIAREMSAELFGASFEIDPKAPQKQVIVDGSTTKWKWKVKPLKEGKEELLTLDVYVHLTVNGKTSPPITIKTFREKILVEVSAWEGIKEFVSAWPPIIAPILTVVGAIWGVYSWVREKKWKVENKSKEGSSWKPRIKRPSTRRRR